MNIGKIINKKMYYINKDLSDKVLFLGVSKKTKGGMTSVLISYDKYIENMHFIPTWKLGNQLVKVWFAFQAIVRMYLLMLVKKKIEIVHIHVAAYASFDRCKLFIHIAKKFKKKIILHEHAADFREFYKNSKNKSCIVDTINLCSKFIVLSYSWKEYFVGIGVHESKIIVLNNVVTPPVGRKTHKPDEKLHLLYMGEVSKRKGCFDMLKAISDHKEFFKDKLLVRIGGNSVDGDINSYIKQNDLDSFVRYEGWVSGDLKTECLIWEDVYILPSYNEGLPIAILEAMSYNHPVISTPVGGIPEVVKDNVNGILVNPSNSKEIANAIIYYLNNKDMIIEHGNNAYEIVKDYFPVHVFNKLKEIYHEVLLDNDIKC